MPPEIVSPWVQAYRNAVLEVDGHAMPRRIIVAREEITTRLKDLENADDHHAERHEIQSALVALTNLEHEALLWPKVIDGTHEEEFDA